MSHPKTQRDDWKSWTLRDWNTALFEYVFSAHDGDNAPVTRLVLTDDEFGRVIGDDSQPPTIIREAFRSAILRRLELSGYTLLADAKTGSSTRAETIPSFFAHLVVTCIAATWDHDPSRPEGEFRKRLNRFLDRDVTSYWLNNLPNLWEELRDWLDEAIDSGLPYRPLILRRQPHLRIIGYSVELAFPSLQDTAELVQLFAESEVALPPSVSLVLSTVQRHLHRFGHRFQSAFEEFDRAVAEHDPLRYRCPFWSVALEAARLSKLRSEKGVRKYPKLELALEFDPDGSSRLVPFLDSSPSSQPPSPHVLIADQFGTVEGYPFALETEPPAAPDETVGGLLLAGVLSRILSRPTTKDIDRLVADGLLLFTRAENQSWLLGRSRPSTGAVRAIIRADLRERFLEAVRARGGKPSVLKAAYQRWFQVDDVFADELPLGVDWVRQIRCLDETISAPRITLAEGVLVPNGWLGLKACLPRVSADCEYLTIEPPATKDHGARTAEFRLDEDGESRWWTIPVHPRLARPLSGRYLIRARQGTAVLAVRPVEFRTHAYGTEYCSPSAPARWLVESGHGDAAGLTSAKPATWGESQAQAERFTSVPVEAMPEFRGDYSVRDTVTTAGEVFAAIGARQQGMDEPEVIDWICRIMGVSRPLAYDVTRAWVEAGLLDCFIYRHWRKRTYYPRQPRLVVHGGSGGGVVSASVMGLIPLVYRGELEDAARGKGLRCGYALQHSPWVPPPLLLESRDCGEFDRLRAECRLGPTEHLPPIEACTVTIDRAASSLPDPPLGYESAGGWDWKMGRFTQGMPEGRLLLERLTRPDAPDVYVVRKEGKPFWIGWSRTWGFLVAANEQRLQLVERAGVHSVRVAAAGLRLPLPLARWSSTRTGICPGPVESGPDQWDYIYSFPGADPVSMVGLVLVGQTARPRWAQRANWLTAVASSRSRTSTRLARVPESVRGPLARSTDPALRRLGQLTAIPRELLSHFLALTREVERETGT